MAGSNRYLLAMNALFSASRICSSRDLPQYDVTSRDLVIFISMIAGSALEVTPVATHNAMTSSVVEGDSKVLDCDVSSLASASRGKAEEQMTTWRKQGIQVSAT